MTKTPIIPLTLADILYKNIIVPLYVKNNILSIYEYQYKHMGSDSIVYKVMYFEPYNLENTLIRYPEYVYHITSIDNKESIDTYGLLPKSETKDLTYPDRVYLFTEYDIHAMVNHIRASGTLNTSIPGWPAVIYKIKPPKNSVLFLDTRALDMNNNIIETCVYSYDAIPPECIIDSEIINIKGQPI